MALFATMIAGCATGNGEQVDPCVRALTKLVDECGYDAEVQGTNLHCTGQSACVAVCLELSPCEDIANNDGAFSDCMDDCQ